MWIGKIIVKDVWDKYLDNYVSSHESFSKKKEGIQKEIRLSESKVALNVLHMKIYSVFCLLFFFAKKHEPYLR